MAHKVFEKPIRVHFSNCDPAGIVFHPQYFVLINELMEDFLEDVAGVGFIEIRRYGVAKTLSQDAAFKSRIKDVYRKTFSSGNTVEQIGRAHV